MIRVAREVVVAPLVAWSRLISPLLGPRCRYEPSCARYATAAIRELGVLRGGLLGIWRVLRCNPWSAGGFDPVSQRSLFKCGHAAGAGR